MDDETGEVIPFVPGDAKVVRVDSETGRFADEITGLTTAVDVAMDDRWNVFVVEMAYAALLPKLFDLFDPDAPPLHSGYLRPSGRVTLYPATRAVPSRLLVEGLAVPTNVTLGPDSALYVSTRQGTPGRSVPGPDGPTKIVGEVVQITNDPSGAGE